MVKLLVSIVLCCQSAALSAFQKPNDNKTPAQSIEELEQKLQQVLNDEHVPGLSVAIVHREGAEWIAGLGKADVASDRAATAETVFRIGSTSKAFASLAILLLVEQGKLSLEDPVRLLAPEVWFENRWEASDPVRIVHLLEHTAGWDDLPLSIYAKEDSKMALREALNEDRRSRVSRWRPGTRMAYCNSGPPVAAYIVEKMTGQKFEDFVRENFFKPIGMKTATFFQPAPESTTTLYHKDGKTPFSYWNILYRPSGSINASAHDMANYLRFYLGRGSVNGEQILPSAAIDRMESPKSTWAAKEGLKAGYGLSNYWSVFDGFVYHGHNGGVSGGLTEMGYMPEEGVGYFFSTNAGNAEAYTKIGAILRSYITRKLQKPPVPPETSLPALASEYAGWYAPNSPRNQLMFFLERLLGLSHVHFKENKLLLSDLRERNRTFLPVTGLQFRHAPLNDSPEPIATLELLTPKEEGKFIQLGLGMTTIKRLPAWLAIGEIVLTCFVVLSIVSILVYAPFWILGGLSKKRRRPAERSLRLWPFIASLSLIGIVVLVAQSSEDFIARMGNLTGWSFALFLATLVFAAAAAASLLFLWRAPRQEVRLSVNIYSTAVIFALVIATAYLAYWGIIGLRLWA